MSHWYHITNRADSVPEIAIYDEIGAHGIQAKAFLEDLMALESAEALNLRINSPGGSVFDGIAIHNALKRHSGKVTVHIDGIAASIASVIAMAGDEIVMPENAMMMIHDPSGLVWGTAADMRAMAEALDKMRDGLVSAYRDKSGQSAEEIQDLMAKETWLTAEEAVEFGFADRMEKPVQMAAAFDLSKFRNTPECFGPACRNTPDSAPKAAVSPDDAPRSMPPSDNTPDLDATCAEDASGSTTQQTVSTDDPPNLDDIRAKERRSTLAYVTEVHELCDLAGSATQAAEFIANETPVAEIRKSLMDTRAEQDEDTVVHHHHGPSLSSQNDQPTIDTKAIYAARNQPPQR